MISELAIIDPSAHIAEGVEIGPWSYIGPGVIIGQGTKIDSHVVIKKNTRIGSYNKIHQFASLGEDPQHLGYKDQQTWLEIGDYNIIREYCSMNRASHLEEMTTKVGSHNFFMSYSHIAHDCIVGDHCIFANNASIAGHVVVGDRVFMGAFTGAHQFCRIGSYSFLGRACKIFQDVPPYMMVRGNPGMPCSLNSVGLKRNGFKDEDILVLRQAFKILFLRKLSLKESMRQIKQLTPECLKLTDLIHFIELSERGIAR